MSKQNPKILFIGGGKMGGAIIEGLLAKGHPAADLAVVDPALPTFAGAQVAASADLLQNFKPDAAILAVKPQMMGDVLPPLADTLSGSLLVSIAAGKSLDFFAEIFGSETRIVRAMPNLPAAIGAGMTGWIGNENLKPEDRTLAQTLLSATGQAHELDTEDQIDAWTAIAGSGPAYVFHFLECLSAAAEDLGFRKDLSDALAAQTLLGSAQLADQSAESFSTLRENVTSPGGTTAAGLEKLMPHLPDLLKETAQAALNRAKELS